MREDELRDRCCFKRCRQESALIFYGVGLCDAHYSQACSVFKPTHEYLIPRVVPAAARLIQDQHESNLEASNGKTEPI